MYNYDTSLEGGEEASQITRFFRDFPKKSSYLEEYRE
jgi:hypothetical protein